VHSTLKPSDLRKVDYGEDIWPDFVTTLFQKLRYGPTAADGLDDRRAGARLALDVYPMTEELIVNERALALRARAPRSGDRQLPDQGSPQL
jgi:hypothetical protein